jgi:leader peptidase (prepilin peptidase)/N-methyltransferase
MIRIIVTVFAALLGLAFGSFLNVCLSRWPQGESVVQPRSHCRHCDHTLAWWENIPLLSWLALRGRCRGCGSPIGWRYPLVELAIGALWAAAAWQHIGPAFTVDVPFTGMAIVVVDAIGVMIFYWLLVALAILDAENLWLPDWLTWPGIALGFLSVNLQAWMNERATRIGVGTLGNIAITLTEILAAAALVLLIRWVYWLVRRREGIGLGDAKLMALLAAWLGLPGALLAFGLGIVLGAGVAVVLLAMPRPTDEASPWGAMRLPLGTFLCIGGIVSGLWGERIIAVYLRWSGF